MLVTGSNIFLMIPNKANQRVLHPGKVLQSDNQKVVCEFEDSIAAGIGSDVIAFGLVKERFFQQAVRVAAFLPTNGLPVVELARMGEAVSAEQRQIYRVSIASNDFRAKIGKEPNCMVVDLSPEGFGAIAIEEHTLGTAVPVLFSIEQHTVNTVVRVQTARRRSDGKFRYGFLVAEKTDPARKALQAMSLIMQRRQLQRLSGAA